MPDITLTVSADWIARFDAYARAEQQSPWEGPGPDTRTTKQLYIELEVRDTKNRILNFERNNRAEFGGDLPAALDDVT